MSQPQQPYPLQAPQENPLAVQVPEYLKKLTREDGSYWDDMGDVEPSDFGLNFLKVVQGMSKQSKSGWGSTGTEPPLAQGTYFLDKSGIVIPEGTDFVPLLRSVTYIKFKGKNTRDGIEFLTKDRDDHRIKAIRGLDWTEKDGERIPPSVTKFVNFYVATVYNLDEPAILSFHKTSTKLGQQLSRDVGKATNMGKRPMYILKFKLTKTALVQDGGNEWYQLRYQPNGFISDKSIERLQRLYEIAGMFEKASRGIGLTEDETAISADSSTGPVMGKGTIIDVQSQPVTTPTVAAQAPTPQPTAPSAPVQQAPAPPAPQPLITPPAPPPQPQAPALAPAATISGW